MRTLSRIVLGLALVMTTVPAAAQQPSPSTPSTRWGPWMGCWQVSEESVDDGARLLAELPGAATQRGAVVCVSPSEQGGATITTLVRDKVVLSETIVADGTQRPISESGCTGSQKAEWSALGARVFARAEITCGNQPARTISGLAAMVAGPMWLDIQMIESEGRKSLRVRRYRPAATQPSSQPLSIPPDGATTPLGTRLSIAEIAEASRNVPVEALQAAVLELGSGGYDLKAKQLRELGAAGVPESVIDLMVAMSFPKKFAVDRAQPTGGFSGMDAWTALDDLWPYMAMWPYAGMWPYMGDVYYSSYYRSRYSPFGYSQWGYFDPRYYYYGYSGFVVVDPGIGTVIPPAAPTGEGRVVDGHGYTRIRRTEPDRPTRVNGNNDGWSTASSSGNGSSSSGSGSSGVSSGGYSSGGSGSGDRVAIPRPPGN